MSEYFEEPCPHRILNDVGVSFTIGACGGALFQGINGFRNAPAGFRNRLLGAVNNVKIRAPITGGNFAAWGAAYTICDCSMIYMREKHDAVNTIVSGAFAGALMASRLGLPAMLGNAFIGGLIMGLIEGAGAFQTWKYANEFAARDPLEGMHQAAHN